MKRPRRNHSSAFKAKVALAAIKGDQISSGASSSASMIAGGVPPDGIAAAGWTAQDQLDRLGRIGTLGSGWRRVHGEHRRDHGGGQSSGRDDVASSVLVRTSSSGGASRAEPFVGATGIFGGDGAPLEAARCPGARPPSRDRRDGTERSSRTSPNTEHA